MIPEIINIEESPLATIHIAKSRKMPMRKPKLVKEYGCPNARRDSGKETTTKQNHNELEY